MSRQDNDDKWNGRADREYERFTNHPVRTSFKWFLGFIAVCIVIGVVIGGVMWISSWGAEAGRVTGVQNTREQVTKILQADADMIASAENACEAKTAAKTSDDPTLIEDPTLAYRATYRRIEADYNARMNNIFEAYITAKNPLPGTINQLPRKAPTLKERMATVC